MIRRSMPKRNLTMMPMSADDMPLMLHKLQGSIHFEKTLTAGTAASNGQQSSGLTIPSWFVQNHGDKFQKTSILRTEPSSKPWPVNLTVWRYSHTCTQVRFAGGWQMFAISHGLLEGDLLIFILKPMSEFKVYLFRSVEGLDINPPPKRRRRISDSDHSLEMEKWPIHQCREADLCVDEKRSDEGTSSPNKKSIAVYYSVLDPIPPFDSVDSVDHPPNFWKTLTASNVRGCREAYLEFPRGFCRKYGNRIYTVVKLQGIHEQSPERTMACRTSFGKDIRHYLRAEWGDFVTENCLHEGQQLLFTLTANSFFVVRERRAM